MILRKLADAIARQDWFLAVLEMLIVVIGLFVGLQLDGWNEIRKERLNETNYLERLYRDIDRDAQLLVRSIEGAERRARDAVYAMEALESAAVVGRRSLPVSRLYFGSLFELLSGTVPPHV